MFKEKKIGFIVFILMMWGITIGIPQPFIAGYSGSVAFAGEKPRFATREVLDTLYSSKRNSMTTARMMAMLTYLLTEQKRTFDIRYGGKKNPTPPKVEEMLNTANYFAAQQKYDEAFEVFQETYNLLTESLEKLSEEGKR